MRIALMQPAAKGNSVGFVRDTIRIKAVQIGKHGLAHELAMHGRNAIDAMRADERKMTHADAAASGFVNQRHRSLRACVRSEMLFRSRKMIGVDPINNIEMSRQHPFEQFDWPGL